MHTVTSSRAAAGLLVAVMAVLASLVAVVGGPVAAGAQTPNPVTALSPGYLLVGADGSVYPMGGSPFLGSLVGIPLSRPIVAAAATPTGDGYWLAAADGGVFAFGDAGFDGSIPGLPAGEQPGLPTVALVPTPDGHGYWEVTAGGDVYSFGDAPFFGSTGAMALAQPIVGAADTPDGGGYWLVAADGGVFAFGDAAYLGSVPGLPSSAQPDQQVVALVPTPDGGGYWEVTTGGDVYTFGDAPFLGSTGGLTLPSPMVAAGATPDGGGYWLVGAGGQVYPFGDAPDDGSLATDPPGSPVVAVVPTPAPAGVSSAPPPPSSSSLTVTTTTVPTATVNSSYSDQLTAAGGTAPYTWSVVGGALPPGLSLTAGGQLTGDPTTAGSSTFTVEVTDSTTPTPLVATATLAMAVSTVPVPLDISSNWAGYVDTGGPYSAVNGTFTVPGVDAAEVGLDAEWVGIGGFSDQTVPVQAGVQEVAAGGPSSTFAWWETPGSDGAQEIDPGTFPVQAGDQVTVDIAEQSPGQWSITLIDDTDGATFTTVQAYDGPGDSAEWVVEAPYLDDPGVYVGEAPLASFSPPVTFTHLAATGSVSGQTALVMADPVNAQLSLSYVGAATPSALDGNGFAVAYGGTAPPAP